MLRENQGPKKMGPCIVPRTMSSTNSATLAVPFKIKGVNYSISSACLRVDIVLEMEWN